MAGSISRRIWRFSFVVLVEACYYAKAIYFEQANNYTRMGSFVDDIRYGFLQRHGAVAQIIVVNVGLYVPVAIVSVVALLMGQGGAVENFLRDYLYLPASLPQLAQRPWTPFSYMFLHSLRDVFHIIFNMLWLFWIGQLYREYLGNARVWSTFVVGGLVGGLLFVVAYNFLPGLSGNTGAYLVGASAGVFAVIVATATLLPNYGIGLLFFGVVKLKWLALIYMLIDFISIPNNPGGMIAHLGGALYGMCFVLLLKRGVNLTQPFERIAEGLKNAGNPSAQNLRVLKKTRVPNKPSQEEVDRLLDKIRAVGYDKLTKEEKQTLFNASKN
jgi:membrane associated rhomboid family serine protease